MKTAAPQRRSPRAWIRPLVAKLTAYTPGEQPGVPGLIKLNTNENPFGPSPKVLAAIANATDARLRLYPNPTADALREKLAAFHRCQPENIIVGNGSDELLEMAVRAFVEPVRPGVEFSRSTVQFFRPSYSLYPVLAAMHGARARPVPLAKDFGIPPLEQLEKSGWNFRAALSLVTTPNAPSGCGYLRTELEVLCAEQSGLVLLDEAYADFAEEPALELAFCCPNVLVTRTFSKAYSLCFLRVGYAVGPAPLIAALQKIRGSYNVNGLGQIAALATLGDLPYYRKNFRRIIQTRQRIAAELASLGFHVQQSQANFIFVRPPRFPARTWLQKFRERKILVRWFDSKETADYLRVSIGREEEMELLAQAAREILTCNAPADSGAARIRK